MDDLSRRIGTLSEVARASAKAEQLRRQRPEKTRATARDCLDRGKNPERRLETMRREHDEPGMRLQHARLKVPEPRQE